LGEQIGLKGTELKDFVKGQQELEREERSRLREEQDKQREDDRIQQDKDCFGNRIQTLFFNCFDIVVLEVSFT